MLEDRQPTPEPLDMISMKFPETGVDGLAVGWQEATENTSGEKEVSEEATECLLWPSIAIGDVSMDKKEFDSDGQMDGVEKQSKSSASGSMLPLICIAAKSAILKRRPERLCWASKGLWESHQRHCVRVV